MKKMFMAVGSLFFGGSAEIPVHSDMSIAQFEVRDIEGQMKKLSDYQGRVVVIVNTASRCGFTPQYESLEKLYDEYKEKGLVVLGFPSNDFGGQEPGSDQEIKFFCQENYDVSFPLFSKSVVKGKEKAPLFQYLTREGGEIGWNFEKFLIDRKGHVRKRFKSGVSPDSKSFRSVVDELIKESTGS